MVNCQSEESAIILMQLPCILPLWRCVIAQPYLVGWQEENTKLRYGFQKGIELVEGSLLGGAYAASVPQG